MGWGDGGQIVGNELDFLGNSVFNRVGFDGCQRL
jgi:hypothetical protein